MATRETKDKSPKTTRRRRATATRNSRDERVEAASGTKEATTSDARALYHREKARRAGVTRPREHPLEQARRAYQALLASEAEKAKGGRPRKTPAPKRAAPGAAPDDDGTED